MHGGIGMTDEHDIGLYMKREAVLSELFGGPRYHAGAGGGAQRLLGPLEQEIDPRRGDRLGRGRFCQAKASTLAMRLPSRSIIASAKVSPRRPAAHIIDRDGHRLHRRPRRRRCARQAR